MPNRRTLALENVAPRQQLMVLRRQKATVRLKDRDRVFWIWVGAVEREGALGLPGEEAVEDDEGQVEVGIQCSSDGVRSETCSGSRCPARVC